MAAHPWWRRWLALAVPLVLVAAGACGGGGDDDEAGAGDEQGEDADQELGPAECGLANGEEATGEPIKVGGIYGTDQVNDFSSGTDAAAAYFDCVNANGGINGRPVDYIVENDEWDPEIAAQVADKLVNDDDVVALAANSSFVEMAVNGPLYEESGIVSVPAACAVRECFESPAMSSTNEGPYPSDLGAVQYAVDELGAENVACIGLNIPTNGVWSCEAVIDHMTDIDLSATFVPLDPASPDCLGALLEATAGEADTVLVTLPAGLAICILGAAEEQDLGDEYNWISPTPLYDRSTPEALGEYWVDRIFIQIELTEIDGEGPDNQNWLAVMDEHGSDDDPRDTFSQGGYLSAKIVTDVLLSLDPDSIDRETVAEAIRAVDRYDSDLMCAPWYFGPGDVHMSNHAGQMVQLVDGGFELVRDCFESPGSFIDDIRAFEEDNGLGASADESFGAG